MNRDDLLTKVAMELAEWGYGVPLSQHFEWVTDLVSEKIKLLYNCPERRTGKYLFEKSDWLQRRKELINEPDDADAPAWANYKAQDGDGEWWWYEDKAVLGSGGIWDSPEGTVYPAGPGKTPAGHDYSTTLKPIIREDKEQEYQVKWVIEVSASSPREAAEQALDIQLDPSSLANHFIVTDPQGEATRQDLNLPDVEGMSDEQKDKLLNSLLESEAKDLKRAGTLEDAYVLLAALQAKTLVKEEQDDLIYRLLADYK